MSTYPPFQTLEGESLDLHICSTIDAKDAVALLYFCGGDEKACVVQPCSLALSQYQIHIGPLGREECVQLPFMSIASWGITRASTSVAKAFAQVQQAEEAARAVASMWLSNTNSSGAVASVSAAASLGQDGVMSSTAVAPMLSPPGQQNPAASMNAATTNATNARSRYADPLPSLFIVTLQTKHVWQHRLIVQSERLLKNLKAHLAMAHCLPRVTDMPAFVYGEERRRHQQQHSAISGAKDGLPASGSIDSNSNSSSTTNASASSMWNTEFGWNLYSPHREFTRQLCVDASRPAPAVATEADVHEGRVGVQRDLRPWFSLVNLRDEDRGRESVERQTDFFYSCSPTYPDLFLEPKLVDREVLLRAMTARSRARVPAVSYVCLRTGAVLARSSQPLMRSAQLGADSDVCYSLINMGYAPHHTHPRHVHVAPHTHSSGITNNSLSAAASPPTSSMGPPSSPAAGGAAAAPAVLPSAASATSLVSPAIAAATAGPRPARPPSLFDDDEADDAAPRPSAREAAAAGSFTPPVAAAMRDSSSPSAAAVAAASSSAHSPSPPSRTSLGGGDGVSGSNANSMENPVSAPLMSVTGATSSTAAMARVLLVADCRPQMTATANAQLGGGYESGGHYAFCQTSFFEIDNIFGVTKAFEKLRGMVARYQGNTVEKTFLRRLYDSDWLAITQRVLVCSVTAAQSLQGGVSCLVHCTDGWDRTSQCTALTMLMLDPYYRTVVGLCTLIEKEFCSFGHKFAERSAHQLPGRTSFFTHSGVASSDTEQQQHGGPPRLDTSPIFLHFLDAVFQMHRQYPTCFEFTPQLLGYLSEVVYGCLYGTFLCNGEQERRLEGVRLRTASVWTDLLRRVQREKKGEEPLRFVNEAYDAATAWKFISQRRRGRTAAGTNGSAATTAANTSRLTAAPLMDFVLLPNCSSKRLVFWEALYTREDADHYLSYNPHVRPLRRQHRVSWGSEFDAFLESEINAACVERTQELAALTALETFMAKEAAKPAVAALAATGARSAWCVYDSVNCFNCYKPFSMWSTKTQCQSCRQFFCTDCQVHDCMLQQY